MGKIIAIMGPTACGKTDLAIRLSQQMPADIISVDSAMVYRDMNIGTAKPSQKELQIASHRLIDFLDSKKPYSAGNFCADAIREINAIHTANRIPLLVGGTMLYFHKLFFGLADLPTANEEVRTQLSREAEKIGWDAMHEKLKKIDSAAATKIKPQDPQRIQRALEVFLLTGKKISDLQKNNADSLLQHHDVQMIALIPSDRQWLRDRIAKRFDQMLASGFIDEVQRLKNRGDLDAEMPSMRIVGYRQAWEYLEGKTDFKTMREKAIAATRQLAKRQLTWLRSWDGLTVLDPIHLVTQKFLDEFLFL